MELTWEIWNLNFFRNSGKAIFMFTKKLVETHFKFYQITGTFCPDSIRQELFTNTKPILIYLDMCFNNHVSILKKKLNQG